MGIAGAGILYVVSTPIGNLEDMTVRALRIMKEADVIVAEDTRHTKHLMNHFDIRKPAISYHAHSSPQKDELLIRRLLAGETLALVSDAGTPGVSDPGGRIVQRAWEEGIDVRVVPGPSALTAALAVSGISLYQFHFGGFLSPKSSTRRRQLGAVSQAPWPLVFFESPHRLVAMLEDALQVLGDRFGVVTRELTKHFEEVKRNRISELAGYFRAHPPRGEFCVIVEGCPKKSLDCPRGETGESAEDSAP